MIVQTQIGDLVIIWIKNWDKLIVQLFSSKEQKELKLISIQNLHYTMLKQQLAKKKISNNKEVELLSEINEENVILCKKISI